MAANQVAAGAVAAGAVRRTVHDTFLDTQSGYVDEQGGLVEMKAYDVLRTPSTPPRIQVFLGLYTQGHRLVGYDNHEHKGDHRHFRITTTPYVFTTVDRLIEDFRRDMAAVKKELGR